MEGSAAPSELDPSKQDQQGEHVGHVLQLALVHSHVDQDLRGSFELEAFLRDLRSLAISMPMDIQLYQFLSARG